MAVTSALILSPPDGYDVPIAIIRPATRVSWVGGTGPTFDIEVQWDVDSGFGTGSLITVTVNNVTAAADVLPTSDLGPLGTAWFTRARVRDDADAVWSSYTTAKQINFTDPRTFNRYLYLLTNVGVAFSPIDEPAGGWGVSEGGTEAADGFSNMMFRFQYLLANCGVAFRFTDQPGGEDPLTEDADWGTAIGGTWADGDPRFFSRFLYAYKNLDTTLPTPFIFSLVPEFGRPEDAFVINGWGFRPYEAWAEGIAPVLASGTWTGVLATLTDGHLPRQTGVEDRPDVAWHAGTTGDPVFTVDLATPRMINEVRVWTRLDARFTSCLIEWSDSGLGGPWTSIGTILGSNADAEGWVTIELWSSTSDFGTHRYWRFSFTDVGSIGEIELNRRMTVGTGDIEARLDDEVTDWLMGVNTLQYGAIDAQSPDSAEEGGLVRVVNTFPTVDLVSNEELFSFLLGISSVDVGLLIKIFDRDAPEELVVIAGDAIGGQYHDLLNGVGSAEFTIPRVAPAWQEANIDLKYNVVRMYLDMVERWWGFLTWTDRVLVDQGGREREGTRFVVVHGLSYFSRAILWPFNWPSLADPDWVYEFVTAGTILIDTITSAQARGTIPRVTFSFTETHDTNGEAWEATFFVTFPWGVTSVLDVIEYLVSLGMDLRFDSQFVLHAYKRRGFELPERLDYQPMIVGQSIQVLRSTEDFQHPANVALVEYGTDVALVYEDPVSTAEWERFETYLSTVGSDATTAQRAAEALVALGGNPLEQISVAVKRIGDEFVPYRDGDLGDTVRVMSRVPQHDGFDKQYRIRGIIVDAGNVRRPQIILDLNSIRLEAIIELQIRGTPPQITGTV